MAVNVRGVCWGSSTWFRRCVNAAEAASSSRPPLPALAGARICRRTPLANTPSSGLMRTAALEGAPLGIRVNTVNPAPNRDAHVRSIEEMRVAALDDATVTVERTKQAAAAVSRCGDMETPRKWRS